MSTIHFHRTTTATPEQFLSALIDFGPGRSKLFGNSADDYLKVHHRGPADLKGRALGLVLGTVGKRVLEKAFGNTVKAVEARNSG